MIRKNKNRMIYKVILSRVRFKSNLIKIKCQLKIYLNRIKIKGNLYLMIMHQNNLESILIIIIFKKKCLCKFKKRMIFSIILIFKIKVVKIIKMLLILIIMIIIIKIIMII
jgi:hypothetical protein